MYERTCQRHTLPLTGGEASTEPILEVPDPEQVDQFIDASTERVPAHPVETPEILNHLASGQTLIESHGRCKKSHLPASLDRILDHIDAKHGGRTTVWAQQRGEAAQRRGLPRPIWSEEGIHLPGGDLESQSVDRREGAVALRERVHSNHGRDTGRHIQDRQP